MNVGNRQRISSILGRVCEAFRETVETADNFCTGANSKSMRQAREVFFFLAVVDHKNPGEIQERLAEIYPAYKDKPLRLSTFFNSARRAYLTEDALLDEDKGLVKATISSLAMRLDIKLERSQIENINANGSATEHMSTDDPQPQ